MALQICTLSGVDETTPLFELAVISDLYPFAEWGFLYSPKQAGTPGRYPTVARIERALTEVPKYVRMALHVRGAGVPQLLDGEPVVNGLVEKTGARNGRVQLDFDATEGEVNLDRLRQLIQVSPAVTFITLHNAANLRVTHHLAGLPNHAVLFEASGGRDLPPQEWPKVLESTSCGYAGGIGPETIDTQLGRLQAAAAGADFWINAEGRIRDRDDRFDLRAARHCLDACLASMSQLVPSVSERPHRRRLESADLMELGMVRDTSAEPEFELMLRRMVNATSDSFDPSIVSVRREAMDLLQRKGGSSPLRSGALDPMVAMRRAP
jgi:hypothetical protein